MTCCRGPSVMPGEQKGPTKSGRRRPMLKNLVKLFKDEEGATALEYALMAAAVAGVIIAVAFLLGGNVKNSINNVAAHIN
jgi:pilus assembly protein Flp/PilA